jgi:hypothetical protein
MPRYSLVGHNLQDGKCEVAESVGSGGPSDVYGGVDALLKRKAQGKRNVPMAAVIGPVLVLVLAAMLYAVVEFGFGANPATGLLPVYTKEEK